MKKDYNFLFFKLEKNIEKRQSISSLRALTALPYNLSATHQNWYEAIFGGLPHKLVADILSRFSYATMPWGGLGAACRFVHLRQGAHRNSFASGHRGWGLGER